MQQENFLEQTLSFAIDVVFKNLNFYKNIDNTLVSYVHPFPNLLSLTRKKKISKL